MSLMSPAPTVSSRAVTDAANRIAAAFEANKDEILQKTGK